MDFLAFKSRYALLGRDFLTWLVHRSISVDGVLPELGAGTEVFFDDALALVGEGDKPAASTFRGTPSSMHEELLAALRSGKKIARAKVHIVRPEGDFAFVLDTDTWDVRGLKVPSGAGDGSDSEAVILERLGLLEQAEAILEKLFAAYLDVRMDAKAYEAWGKEIAKWCEEG